MPEPRGARSTRTLRVPDAYSLAVSTGPAQWIGDRSGRHAWIDDALVWCGREETRTIWRSVRQPRPGVLEIAGSGDPDRDAHWVAHTLHPESLVEHWDDPVLADIAARYPGLAPYGDGSLFDGLITCIVGQSITVVAAAVTQTRLSRLFDGGIEVAGRAFTPLPVPEQLADASVALIRESGVTTRRADALKRIGRIAAEGGLPSDERARSDPEEVRRELLGLPQIGPWTAVSALMWGVGAPDAWPTGDVALLRAMKQALDDPDLTLKTIDTLADAWRPYRGIAARLFWTNLFGTA